MNAIILSEKQIQKTRDVIKKSKAQTRNTGANSRKIDKADFMQLLGISKSTA